MYYFIVLVALDIVFEILNYFWSSIGDIFKKNSPWSDCPKDLEFWHSVHSIVALVILCLILLIFGRFRNRFIPPLFLMRFATVLQLFSLYWLVLGWVWIEEVLTKDKSCMPETTFEVVTTYIGGAGLWILELFLIVKSFQYGDYNRELNLPSIEIIQKLDEVDLAEESLCAICLDAIRRGVSLSCSHVFHKFCIERWVASSATCPYCRAAI